MIIERGYHSVFDEPFSRSYYYGPDRRSDRFTESLPASSDSELLDMLEKAAADVVESLGQPLVVVDAAELCSDPGGVVAAWCAAMDLPFMERALTWEPGMRPEWELWSDWHSATAESIGFRPLQDDASAPDEPRLRDVYEHAALVYRRILITWRDRTIRGLSRGSPVSMSRQVCPMRA